MWRVKQAPSLWSSPSSVPQVEKLTFELWVKQGGHVPYRLGDLGFGPNHPRGWGRLPTDEQLYVKPDDVSHALYGGLWRDAAVPLSVGRQRRDEVALFSSRHGGRSRAVSWSREAEQYGARARWIERLQCKCIS